MKYMNVTLAFNVTLTPTSNECPLHSMSRRRYFYISSPLNAISCFLAWTASHFAFFFFLICKLSIDFKLTGHKVQTRYIFDQLTRNNGWSLLHPNHTVSYMFGISSHQMGSTIARPTYMRYLPLLDIETPPLDSSNDHMDRNWGRAAPS